MRLHALIPTIVCLVGLTAAELTIGGPASALEVTTSHNTRDGGPVTLASLRGQVVLIDFWATWCEPCVASIPHIQALHAKYGKQGLVVLGHTDGSSRELEAFIAEQGITYAITVGPDIGDAFGVTAGIPYVVLIDPEGKVAWHGRPKDLSDAKVAALVLTAKRPGEPAPTFATTSGNADVARIEAGIAAGQIGGGVAQLAKLAADAANPVAAAAAASSLETIAAWRAKRDSEIAGLRANGDIHAAWTAVDALATAYAGHDDAIVLAQQAAALRSDPQWEAGREYARLAALPAEQRNDPGFARQVEAFLGKWPEGLYARKVIALGAR